MDTSAKPEPGLMDPGVAYGVTVTDPTKRSKTNGVEIGWLKSCVGRRTMVGEGVMLGVRDGVDVSAGVNVMAAVDVGAGAPNEHACKKSARIMTSCNLRI
jgi:hypothetical protein